MQCFDFEIKKSESTLPFTILGRNRWVIYNEKTGVEYDGSMVPAEWFGWLHYKTDFPPTIVKIFIT